MQQEIYLAPNAAIGIARGLYREAEIYIFDESTNAIDKLTENQIINNLKVLF